uniref:Uncharacterized protein n=1 Tax=Euplotes crassus TaxID=5936 RepID=A0A7S3KAM3_EUPCR|mmetsp:Transcript_18141/g.17837  ORF Transcript_18141/g.17837 Transcript_18141/m.17837 type:complete len:176 (+) Transcript_18141:130-657(+)
MPFVNHNDFVRKKNFSSFDNTNPSHRRIKSKIEVDRMQNMYEMFLKSSGRGKNFKNREDEDTFMREISSDKDSHGSRPQTPKKMETLFIKSEKFKGGEYPASLLFMDFNRRELIDNFFAQGTVVNDEEKKEKLNKEIYQKFNSKYGLSRAKNQDAKIISNNIKIKLMLKDKMKLQ